MSCRRGRTQITAQAEGQNTLLTDMITDQPGRLLAAIKVCRKIIRVYSAVGARLHRRVLRRRK